MGRVIAMISGVELRVECLLYPKWGEATSEKREGHKQEAHAGIHDSEGQTLPGCGSSSFLPVLHLGSVLLFPNSPFNT